MLGLLFLLLIGGLLVYGLMNRDRLMDRGARRFGEREGFEGVSAQPRRRALPRRGAPAVAPAAPAFSWRHMLENRTCELCSSPPLVQYRNAATKSALEFCGHHAGRQHEALQAKGFTVSVDGRQA